MGLKRSKCSEGWDPPIQDTASISSDVPGVCWHDPKIREGRRSHDTRLVDAKLPSQHPRTNKDHDTVTGGRSTSTGTSYHFLRVSLCPLDTLALCFFNCHSKRYWNRSLKKFYPNIALHSFSSSVTSTNCHELLRKSDHSGSVVVGGPVEKESNKTSILSSRSSRLIRRPDCRTPR